MVLKIVVAVAVAVMDGRTRGSMEGGLGFRKFDVSRKCAVSYTAHCKISSGFLRLCYCAFAFQNNKSV